MRKDLNKLLCERERRGSKNHFRYFRKMKIFSHARGEELEDLPSRESMKCRYNRNYDRKEFNENLNPLYGFVRKSVGKKWDETYSELCEVFDMSSVINNHILEHLAHTVETKIIEEDSELFYRWYNRALQPVIDKDGPEYYVHPRTGVLLKNEKYESYRQRSNRYTKYYKSQNGNTDERKVISDSLEYRLRNGIWFACEMESFPRTEEKKQMNFQTMEYESTTVDAKRFDMWLHANVEYDGRFFYGWWNKGDKPSNPSKPGTFVKKVRTASRKELKEHGIK